MTTFDNFGEDADRFNYLFEVATGEASPDDKVQAEISAREWAEVEQIRKLVTKIEEGWVFTRGPEASVWALFLKKLAVQEPQHPWVVNNTVRTLGELARAGKDDLPDELSTGDVYERITQDSTPVETLMSKEGGRQVLGEVLKRLALPQPRKGDFILWLYHALADLMPVPDQAAPSLIYTRPQRQPRARR